jgi:hypothetical protein
MTPTSIRLSPLELEMLDALAAHRALARGKAASRSEAVGWLLRRAKPGDTALGAEAVRLRAAHQRLTEVDK